MTAFAPSGSYLTPIDHMSTTAQGCLGRAGQRVAFNGSSRLAGARESVALLEAFLGAAIAGFGLLLAAVAGLAGRRSSDRKMAVLAAAFALAGVGGALSLVGELAGGSLLGAAPVLLAACMLATLLLLYAALFAGRK